MFDSQGGGCDPVGSHSHVGSPRAMAWEWSRITIECHKIWGNHGFHGDFQECSDGF